MERAFPNQLDGHVPVCSRLRGPVHDALTAAMLFMQNLVAGEPLRKPSRAGTVIALGAVHRARIGLPGLLLSQFHPMQRGQLLRQVRKKMAVSGARLLSKASSSTRTNRTMFWVRRKQSQPSMSSRIVPVVF